MGVVVGVGEERGSDKGGVEKARRHSLWGYAEHGRMGRAMLH